MNASADSRPLGSKVPSDQEAFELLKQLVEIPSLSGQEGHASTFFACWLASHGFAASVDESGSAVGVLTGPPAPGPARDIVLLGHIDTVPGFIPVTVQDGQLWGRGSVDAKGSLATFAAAAAGLVLPVGVRVIVIGATEEEAASSRGARHAAAQFNPSACVIGEPSGAGAVTIAYKGRLNFHAKLTTGASHSAGPGTTAAENAVAAWNTVRELTERLTPDRSNAFDHIQARLRSLNTRSDGLHDTAEAHVGLRLPSGIDPYALEAQIRTALVGVDLRFDGHEFAHEGDPRSWLVRSLTGAIRNRGHKPRLLRKTGTSDMNVVARSWKCPIVAYGPGDSSLDHTPHERLEIQEYFAAIHTLRTALEEIVRHVADGESHPPAAPAS